MLLGLLRMKSLSPSHSDTSRVVLGKIISLSDLNAAYLQFSRMGTIPTGPGICMTGSLNKVPLFDSNSNDLLSNYFFLSKRVP